MKLWDIRAKQVVHELSTGNNCVEGMAWNMRDNTLYAVTSCEYLDRMGRHHGYRRARLLKPQKEIVPQAANAVTSEPAKKRRKTETGSVDADEEDEDMSDHEEDWEDEDEDADEEEDEEDELYADSPLGEGWPEKAYHLENYFGCQFDAAEHCLST